MLVRIAADLVVLAHLGFILFVILGGLLVLRWPRIAWNHIPAAIWGTLIEFGGWICPLTPLENWLREAGGTAGYKRGFIEHYIVPIGMSGVRRAGQVGMTRPIADPQGVPGSVPRFPATLSGSEKAGRGRAPAA